MKEYLLLCGLMMSVATTLAASVGTCSTCPTTEAPRPLVRCPECVNNLCIYNECDDAVLLPYPGDCSKFCLCDSGGAIEMLCPDGLEFDLNSRTCQWPSVATCSIDTPYPGCTAPLSPDFLTYIPQNPCRTTVAPRPTERCPACASAQCTPNMCNLAQNIPYPGDCSRFCTCDSAGAIAMDCPDGLIYNPVLDACVWPDSDYTCSNNDPYPGCNGTTTTTKPPTTTTTKPPTTTTTKPPTTTTTTRPPTTTTTKPPTTTTTTLPTTTTTTKPPTTTTTVVPTTTTTTIRPNDPPESPPPCATLPPLPTKYCPACVSNQCNEQTTLLPYPKECSKYCSCTGSGAVEMECPSGLVFTGVGCDFPGNSNCKNTDPYPGCDAPLEPTSPRPTPVPTTTLPPRPLTRCPECVNGMCTPNMCNQADTVPFPGDCSKFCICDSTGAIEMDCPSPLVYDATSKVCTWSSQSSCSNNEIYPGCELK